MTKRLFSINSVPNLQLYTFTNKNKIKMKTLLAAFLFLASIYGKNPLIFFKNDKSGATRLGLKDWGLPSLYR